MRDAKTEDGGIAFLFSNIQQGRTSLHVHVQEDKVRYKCSIYFTACPYPKVPPRPERYYYR